MKDKRKTVVVLSVPKTSFKLDAHFTHAYLSITSLNQRSITLTPSCFYMTNEI